MDVAASDSGIIRTQCVIAGGGPAGMMLGFLMARSGVAVVILEKHADFLRDFRGDTIHPSTLELMHELGLLEEFLREPHQKVREIQAHFGAEVVTLADFSHLPTHCRYVAFMPQWDFLNFLAKHARRFPGFDLRMQCEVTGLIMENSRVAGVRAKTAAGEIEVRADLVVGADGRSSLVRELANLEVVDLGAPMDVIWFRLSRRPTDPPQSFGHIGAGKFMVMLNRDSYWQCGFVIHKGDFEKKHAAGLEAFRDEIVNCASFLNDRVGELHAWDDLKLLTVKVDHLKRWFRDGLLCIGDSAHAMSPVGGVGINLAIQDAVATANLLSDKLRKGGVKEKDLQAVQRRRERPARITQRVQVFIHEHFLRHVFEATEQPAPPWPARLTERFPMLRRIPARMIGLGFRPEHIEV